MFSVTMAVPSAVASMRDGERHEVGREPGERQGLHVSCAQSTFGANRQPVGSAVDLHPGLRELAHDGLEVLELDALDRDGATRGAARHDERAGLDAIADDRVLHRMQLVDTFDRDGRRPRAVDLRAHVAQERGEIATSGSRRVLDHGLALGDDRRGEHGLGRADARELEHDLAPQSALQRASMKPCTTSSSAPIAWSARKCMSSLRLPMLSPPGIATRAMPAREQRAEHVDRRAHPADELVRRFRLQRLRHIESQRAGAGPLDVGADRAQQVDHHVEVGDRREVAKHGDARREQRRGHLLEAGVLGHPRDADRPGQGRAAPEPRTAYGQATTGRRRTVDAGSAALVDGGPLLDEGRDGLLHVVGTQALGLSLGLDDQALARGDRSPRR